VPVIFAPKKNRDHCVSIFTSCPLWTNVLVAVGVGPPARFPNQGPCYTTGRSWDGPPDRKTSRIRNHNGGNGPADRPKPGRPHLPPAVAIAPGSFVTKTPAASGKTAATKNHRCHRLSGHAWPVVRQRVQVRPVLPEEPRDNEKGATAAGLFLSMRDRSESFFPLVETHGGRGHTNTESERCPFKELASIIRDRGSKSSQTSQGAFAAGLDTVSLYHRERCPERPWVLFPRSETVPQGETPRAELSI